MDAAEPTSATIEREVNRLGSGRVEYEYDDRELYISSEAQLKSSESAAGEELESFDWAKRLIPAFAGGDGDLQLESCEPDLKGVDDLRCEQLIVDGAPGGLVFAAQKGARVLLVMLGGVRVDATFYGQVLQPHLDALGGWKP